MSAHALAPEEARFLQRQMEIHLMEAHVALVKAGACAQSYSETDDDIKHAVNHVGSALERKSR